MKIVVSTFDGAPKERRDNADKVAAMLYGTVHVGGTNTLDNFIDILESVGDDDLLYIEDDVKLCKDFLYEVNDVIDLYNDYNNKNNIVQYDYIYERDFREKVLEFLQNGEYKLFKSPTEGNVIVRLMDVNCVPNQQLGRMLYSFTSNAFEMDECTMTNYLKYGFYKIDPISSDFAIYETKLGQLSMDFPVGTNVFEEIYKKYDSGNRNIGGYTKKVGNIHHIKITFDDKPLRVRKTGGGDNLVMGNNFNLNGKVITVYNPNGMYEFDNRLIYTTNDSLIILGNDPEIKNVDKVHATIDFLYEVKSDPYQPKKISSRHARKGLGQIAMNYEADENLYNDIYYKYYLDLNNQFQKITNLTSIEIEAVPGAIFSIQDESEIEPEEHMIGATGQLRLYEIENMTKLIYLGVKDPLTREIQKINTDILVNYIYTLLEGTYKEE